MAPTLKAHFLKISFSEFCDRLNYYGLQSLLVLYLIAHFNVSTAFSYTVYGQYVALTFASCILGGMIADKFLAPYQSVFLGTTCMFMGNLIIIYAVKMNLFFAGMTLIIVAIGLMKPATSTLVGILHNKMSKNNKLFVYFYTLGNIGSILGPIFYGIGISLQKYWIGFGMSALILILNMVMLHSTQHRIVKRRGEKRVGAAAALILPYMIIIYLVVAKIVSIFYIFAPAALFLIGYLYKLFAGYSAVERRNVGNLWIPLIASILFFIALLQVFSSVTIFINENVNTTFFGFKLPVTWFSSIEAISVFIVAAPITYVWQWLGLGGKYGAEISHVKIAVGLSATAIAFMLFAVSVKINLLESHAAILSILFANFFLSIGELSIIPVSISLISEYAPVRQRNFFMGIFYFLLSFSGYLSGLIAKITAQISYQNESHFEIFFLVIASAILGVAMLLFALIPFMRINTSYK
ncbi:MAG: hypothetical protein K0R48_230 [Gammaproteobacteria bacterium]|jgi:POT family proton-dependent oligopeptide transporter|nr:hypothetical protein [Gammaproteobacteria bacterium]